MRLLHAATVLLVLPALFTHVASTDDTKSADDFLEDAKKFLAEGQTTDALRSYESALHLRPDDYLARFRKAGNKK